MAKYSGVNAGDDDDVDDNLKQTYTSDSNYGIIVTWVKTTIDYASYK